MILLDFYILIQGLCDGRMVKIKTSTMVKIKTFSLFVDHFISCLINDRSRIFIWVALIMVK